MKTLTQTIHTEEENFARDFCSNTPRLTKESGVAFYQRLVAATHESNKRILQAVVVEIEGMVKDQTCTMLDDLGYHSKECWDECNAARSHNAALSTLKTTLIEAIKV